MKRYLLGFAALASQGVFATGHGYPSGQVLSSGPTHLGAGAFSVGSNPAAPASNKLIRGEDQGFSMAINVGGGVEYGNVDELFELYNNIADALDPSGGDTGGNSGASSDPNEPAAQLPASPSYNDFVNNGAESLRGWLGSVDGRAAYLSAAFALMQEEAYAFGDVGAEIPVLISNNILGGTLSFSVNSSISTKAVGIADLFDFDVDQSISTLDSVLATAVTNSGGDLNNLNLPSQIALSDDIAIGVSADDINVEFTNESAFLVKGAKVSSLSLNYSREVFEFSFAKVVAGVRPKFYQVGLTQVDVKLGDITDAEKIFDDVKNAEFKTDNKLSMDLGATLVGNNYSVGLSVLDPFGPTFKFPELSNTYTKAEVIERLKDESEYKMKPQGRIEGGYYLFDSRLAVNGSYDLNSAESPMGSETQWANLSAVYDSRTWLIPDARIGYRSNLAGTKLDYVTLGVTFFNTLTLDTAFTMDKVTIDDSELPKGMNVSLGFNYGF